MGYFLLSFSLLICSILLGSAIAFPKSQHKNVRLVNGNALSYRAERYLFPFAVINFPPEPCSPTNTNQMEGVCLSRKRCSASGGESVGACQQGIGTCCKFNRQCLANKRTMLVTEAVENLVQSSMAGSCEFLFPKQPGLCQIRLDFDNVMLQPPQSSGPNAGNCQSESITVSGAANLNNPLKVCGRLNKQHMILSYGASDPISVIIHSEVVSNNFVIRATQIPCNSVNKAPDDCLQYFTSSTAAVKSFGFPQQLNNQKYTICVKPTSGGSTFTWERCNEMDAENTISDKRFLVSGSIDSITPSPPTPCMTDWITIDSEKRCGRAFPALTTTDSGSHTRIRVHFDENEIGNDIFNITTMDWATVDQDLCETNSIVTNPNVETAGFAAANQKMNCKWHPSSFTCQCQFSNMPDKDAQALTIRLDGGGGVFIKCPIIQGYTATPLNPPPPTGNMDCTYYANVRVTDIENTGFCLRYQAM